MAVEVEPARMRLVLKAEANIKLLYLAIVSWLWRAGIPVHPAGVSNPALEGTSGPQDGPWLPCVFLAEMVALLCAFL